jgi:hypothetical protein
MEQQSQMSIDFTTTTSVEGFDGNLLFGQAFILRKISRFTIGSSEYALIPIPVFYDLETKRIILDSLPPEIREEYKDISI